MPPVCKFKKVGMKRAKKTKVAARKEALQMATDSACPGAEVEAPALEPADPPQAPSPGRAERKQAEEELEELFIEYDALEELDGDAAKELTCAKRIFEAKQRRIETSQAGKRHGSPFGELERIYKSHLDLSQAKLKREIISSMHGNAEANWLAQQCRVLRLENAKLRRVMRAHRVRVPK
jgi:hypothetical protein